MRHLRAPLANYLTNGLLILALTLIATPAVLADGLDTYKASGAVGEKLDGYVGIVTPSPSDQIRATVNDINKKRRAKYASIAKERGIDVSQVAALAGKKLAKRTPSGQYIQDDSGKWRKRK